MNKNLIEIDKLNIIISIKSAIDVLIAENIENNDARYTLAIALESMLNDNGFIVNPRYTGSKNDLTMCGSNIHNLFNYIKDLIWLGVMSELATVKSINNYLAEIELIDYDLIEIRITKEK